MRRRRKQLEVSTFPFLAVLLCTMGSLILVLLVMDRKAKLAARQKEDEEVARAAEDTRRAAEERRAALQRRKDEARAATERQRKGTHERLVSDEKDLQNQLRLLALRLAEATAAVGQGRERLEGLRKQVEAERVRVIESELALKRDRLAASGATEASEETKAAVAAAIAEVAKLESLLAELKAARAREGHTHSVVPYRGKRGDDRRPVYVECTAHGAVFQPDRKELPSPLRADDVRAEVERHLARFAENVRPAKAEDDRPPYCLLLVRPDGIGPYYDLQAVLRSLRIDFGYEFIDADWLLDFPDDEQTASRTWGDGSDNGPTLAPTPRTGIPLKGLPPARPPMPGGSQPGNGPASPGPSVGPGAPAGWPSTSAAAPGTGEPSGSSRSGPRPGVVRPGTTGARGVQGTPGDTRAQGTPAAPADPGVPGTAGPQRTAAVPGTITTPGHTGAQGNAGNPTTREGVEPRSGATPASTPGRPGDAPPPGEPADGARPPASGSPGPKPPADDTTLLRGQPPSGSGSPPAATGQPSPPVGTGSSPSQTGLPSPPVAFRPRPRSSGGDEEPVRRAARLSDRDWVIFIECRPNDVILHPARTEFPLTALTAPPASNELLAAVKKMIERRQAVAAPGDVPYRPHVRFLIRPDSLRTLYLAYPAFEALPVPKTRQNLAAEDDVRSGTQGARVRDPVLSYPTPSG